MVASTRSPRSGRVEGPLICPWFHGHVAGVTAGAWLVVFSNSVGLMEPIEGGKHPGAAGPVGEGPGRELGGFNRSWVPWSPWITPPGTWAAAVAAGVDGRSEGVRGELGAGPGVDRPADDPAGVGVQDKAAVQLSLPVGVARRVSVAHSWLGSSRWNVCSMRSVIVRLGSTRLPALCIGSLASPARLITRMTVL